MMRRQKENHGGSKSIISLSLSRRVLCAVEIGRRKSSGHFGENRMFWCTGKKKKQTERTYRITPTVLLFIILRRCLRA